MAALQNGAVTLVGPRSRRFSGDESAIGEAENGPAQSGPPTGSEHAVSSATLSKPESMRHLIMTGDFQSRGKLLVSPQFPGMIYVPPYLRVMDHVTG